MLMSDRQVQALMAAIMCVAGYDRLAVEKAIKLWEGVGDYWQNRSDAPPPLGAPRTYQRRTTLP